MVYLVGSVLFFATCAVVVLLAADRALKDNGANERREANS